MSGIPGTRGTEVASFSEAIPFFRVFVIFADPVNKGGPYYGIPQFFRSLREMIDLEPERFEHEMSKRGVSYR